MEKLKRTRKLLQTDKILRAGIHQINSSREKN